MKGNERNRSLLAPFCHPKASHRAQPSAGDEPNAFAAAPAVAAELDCLRVAGSGKR